MAGNFQVVPTTLSPAQLKAFRESMDGGDSPTSPYRVRRTDEFGVYEVVRKNTPLGQEAEVVMVGSSDETDQFLRESLIQAQWTRALSILQQHP